MNILQQTTTAAQAKEGPPFGFAVALTYCVESAAVGLVSTERAQRLLPVEFTLANDGKPVTPLVVLATQCGGIAVAGRPPSTGTYVQVGLIIVPPDGTGQINTFMLWHYTTDAMLARAFKRAGLPSQFVPGIDYELTLGGKAGSTHITVPAPAQPPLAFGGKISEPTQPLTFAGNWWAKVDGGLLKMASTVPNGLVGEADLTLTTRADNPLGQLIGSEMMGFAVLQRFNRFKQARTDVSLFTPPSLPQ